jgi:hypothetical protein
MNLLTLLILVALIVAVAALTGLKPKGTRSIRHTRLMKAGAVALVIFAIVIAYLVYQPS